MSELECTRVHLAQMLARRDARAASQRALLALHQRPLLQLTLVSPGPLKDTALLRALFAQGLSAIQALLAALGLPVLAQQLTSEATGPEALLVVDTDARALKRHLVALEDGHPLGRLWDVDVLDLDGQGIPRSQLGLPARGCLLCDQPAHACARSAAHTLPELQQVIAERWRAYVGTRAA